MATKSRRGKKLPYWLKTKSGRWMRVTSSGPRFHAPPTRKYRDSKGRLRPPPKRPKTKLDRRRKRTQNVTAGDVPKLRIIRNHLARELGQSVSMDRMAVSDVWRYAYRFELSKPAGYFDFAIAFEEVRNDDRLRAHFAKRRVMFGIAWTDPNLNNRSARVRERSESTLGFAEAWGPGVDQAATQLDDFASRYGGSGKKGERASRVKALMVWVGGRYSDDTEESRRAKLKMSRERKSDRRKQLRRARR